MTSSDPQRASGSFATVDRILRGHYLQPESLADGRIDIPIRVLARYGLVLGAIYGISLGTYAAFQGGSQALLQMLSTAIKVPALFLLTLTVTFPSLYVFSALQRSPLSLQATCRLLLLAVVVDVAVLASLGPVFAFFAASTESYPFMLLLNVAFFAIGGILGLIVLRRATQAMFTTRTPTATAPAPTPPPPPAVAADTAADPVATAATPATPAPTGEPTAPRTAGSSLRQLRSADQARSVLTIWCLVYGVVGAQMGWLLRPFLGAPGAPFAWIRERESNVFAAILRTIRDLFAQ
ncbi:MAG: hypothetical protein IPK26_19545 [Planctomycetes bacterium]|nr:hypothetical protein [Planctomycetota bacterium]